MKKSLTIFALTIIIAGLGNGGTAYAGVLKSLDNELTSLVEKTEPYLVTVRGEGQWRNLVATGIIFNKDGYVLTSSAIYDTDGFHVIFKNGQSVPAEKIGVDPQTGLALLKIEPGDLQTPSWGDSRDLKSGSWVMVVGNSYGTPSTVNFGTFEDRSMEDFLKLRVSVSPGTSGGAVLNTDGKVVGILIARESSDSSPDDYTSGPYAPSLAAGLSGIRQNTQDMAIAVPIESAIDVAEQIIKNGRVKRGFLGISQRNLSPADASQDIANQGVEVIDVVDGSPADSAGLTGGDVIVEISNESVKGSKDLFTSIRSRKPGDRIEIVYRRDGETYETSAVLTEADNETIFGNWHLPGMIKGLNVGRQLELMAKNDLERQMDRIESEISRLGEELTKLREKAKEQK